MANTLRLLRTEQNEDGHTVSVYRADDGTIERITTMPTIAYLNHQTAILAATVQVLQQRTAKELAEFELEEARRFMRERSQRPTAPRQIGPTLQLRALPAPKR